MRRREFIAGLGGVAVWPLVARAQQSVALRIIGFLGPASASAMSPWKEPFERRLRELGWVEGRTIANRISVGRRTQQSLCRSHGGLRAFKGRCHRDDWDKSPSFQTAHVVYSGANLNEQNVDRSTLRHDSSRSRRAHLVCSKPQ
jgi:hypothetical protein